ncbi:MAG: DUF3761 domain-containing protein [Cytophagales bacterium]|nr:DUF3761 domain-containing protein [Bernardetiaceae bacterium]MDW8210433.1 DUF3761 domain-containing protein [Cytophagales bacterium]
MKSYLLVWAMGISFIAFAQNDSDTPPGFFSDEENENLPVRIQPTPNDQRSSQEQDGQHAPPPPPDPETLRTYIRVGAICKDGTRSYSVSSGTCSGHGGVAFWLYGPPGTPPDTPLEQLVQIAPGQRRRTNHRVIPLEPSHYYQQAVVESDPMYGWIYRSRHPAAIFVDILIIVLAFLQVGWFIRKAIERYRSGNQQQNSPT